MKLEKNWNNRKM